MSRIRAAREAAQRGDHAALVDAIPYAKFLGVKLVTEGARLLSVLPFRAGLVGNQTINAIHGGVTAAFMENAALLHLLLRLDQERVPKSIDFAIDYLLPGQALDTYAECKVSRAGVRVAQVQVNCWQKSEQVPIAVARAHFLLTAPE
ncbi:MAG TPA: PaaI family thioesterase [Nevskiaceae bacterium]|nr:PaaI family thioesterase [Nevskiaceae bacterium]